MTNTTAAGRTPPLAIMAPTAQALATTAHATQKDKAGMPYIGHPARVAARLAGSSDSAIATAWLHDVLEDTSVTEDDLRSRGFSADVITAVLCLTKRRGEPLDAYYQRVRNNPLALEVKAADIADNMDPKRTAKLDETTRTKLAAKYTAARIALGLDQNPVKPQ